MDNEVVPLFRGRLLEGHVMLMDNEDVELVDLEDVAFPPLSLCVAFPVSQILMSLSLTVVCWVPFLWRRI